MKFSTIDVMESPCTSYWLKEALQKGLSRDPVDAVNDAEILLALLQERLRTIQEAA